MIKKLPWMACVFGALLQSPVAHANILDNPEFRDCELEAFIALGAARQALFFKNSKAELLKAGGNKPDQVEMLDDLYAGIENKTYKNHGAFAAKRWNACAQKSQLSLPANNDGAWLCLLRLDISFFLLAYQQQGATMSQAIEKTRQLTAKNSAELFPPKLIDFVAPMVYQLKDGYDLPVRQVIFESCLFPDAFQEKMSQVKK